MRNNGDGTFGARVDYGVGSNRTGIAFGDIDGDGDIDIAVANQSSNTVWTRSNSPYIVSGHIGVDAGVKLRIESGVRVVFKGRI